MLTRWINSLLPSLEVPPLKDGDLPDRLWPFIWFFVRQVRRPVLITCGIYTIAQCLMLTEPIFIGQLVGTLVDRADGVSARLAALFIAYMLVVQVAARLLFMVGWKIECLLFPLLTARIRAQLADYLTRHSYRFFQDDFAGRLSGKVIEMPTAIMQTLLDLTTAFLFTMISLVFTYVCLFLLHWSFGLVATVYVIVFCYTIFVRAPRLHSLSQSVAQARNLMRGHFIDSISNILLVKTFARERHEQARLQQDLQNVTAQDQAENMVFRAMGMWQHINNAWLQILTALLAVYGWSQGWFSATTVATALPMVAVMAGNSWWLLHTSGFFFNRLGEIREGMADLVRPLEVQDRPGTGALVVRDPSVTFRNVTFSYPGRPVFSDFSLHIPARQKVGIVGPSGAGKSTLAQLLLRLHDVQDGAILIDGHPIDSVTQSSLREQIAFIPQSSDLLHRSIADNIRYGRLDAPQDDIETAAMRAHAHDFIPDLSDKTGNTGYAALVGERGVKLSGGQRQRLAIARASLKDAPVLLLDEATSALDSESEKLIQQSLQTLMHGRTVLVIAHRLSTIAHLDRLIVIDHGRIVEDGHHNDLIARGGLYARLWSLQSSGFLGDGQAGA